MTIDRERNRQKQVWIEMKDLLRLRQHKSLKQNGRIETDAETFKKIIDNFEKKEMNRSVDFKIKLDKRSLF
jgi:hypothetical protein